MKLRDFVKKGLDRVCFALVYYIVYTIYLINVVIERIRQIVLAERMSHRLKGYLKERLLKVALKQYL